MPPRQLVELTSPEKAADVHIGNVGNHVLWADAEFTRPNNVTAYSINDVVSNSTSATALVKLSGIGRVKGGTGLLTKFKLSTSKADCVAQFRLHIYIYPETQVTVPVDNALLQLLWADRGKHLAYLDLPALATEDPSSTVAFAQSLLEPLLPFECASGDDSLYVLLETKTAFTPVGQQKFYLYASAMPN